MVGTVSMNATKQIPAVGSLVRPVGSELVYRVVESFEHGCRVEAVSTEATPVPGRQSRPLHYSEKRFSLACSRDTGMLFDGSWRGWETI